MRVPDWRAPGRRRAAVEVAGSSHQLDGPRPVTSLRITVNITMNRTDRAIEVGLQLRPSGIEWSAHPGEDEVQAEYNLLWRLGEHPIETVAELASTRDLT